MADDGISRLPCTLDLEPHQFKPIGEVLTFFCLVDVVTDELIVGEASKEMPLAILVDLLEEFQQISSFGVEYLLKFGKLNRMEDRTLLVPTLQQCLDYVFKGFIAIDKRVDESILSLQRLLLVLLFQPLLLCFLVLQIIYQILQINQLILL